MIGQIGVWELQVLLLVRVGVGALAKFVDQCPERTGFGESGEEERRGRAEEDSDGGKG